MVASGDARVAGNDDHGGFGGGRSSGTCGFGVVVLGRGSWWFYVLLVRFGARWCARL